MADCASAEVEAAVVEGAPPAAPDASLISGWPGGSGPADCVGSSGPAARVSGVASSLFAAAGAPGRVTALAMKKPMAKPRKIPVAQKSAFFCMLENKVTVIVRRSGKRDDNTGVGSREPE